MIRRPTSAEVGLVGQQQKASLESAEWAKEIYHGSKKRAAGVSWHPLYAAPHRSGRRLGPRWWS